MSTKKKQATNFARNSSITTAANTVQYLLQWRSQGSRLINYLKVEEHEKVQRK
jgi:hypothetical protein